MPEVPDAEVFNEHVDPTCVGRCVASSLGWSTR